MDGLEILATLHRAYNRHDASAAASLYAAHGRHVEAAHDVERVGPEAVQAGLEGLFRAFPDVTWEPNWLLGEGPTASAGYRLTATANRGGAPRPIELRGVHFIRVGNKEIVRSEDYWDRQALAEQLAIEDTRGSAREVAHVCNQVVDLERALGFYRRLGFEERRRFEAAGEELHVFLGLPNDGDRLELVAQAAGDVAAGPAQHLHVGVLASGLDALLVQLLEAGIRPEAPPASHAPGRPRVCVVRDPDGFAVELIETAAR